jgi:hypothetical protein
MATIIIGSIVLLAVILAVWSIYSSKKKHGGCGYGCEGCTKR